MEYTVRFKLTSDLTPEDWDAYVKAFNDVFNKDYTVEQLKSKYAGDPAGERLRFLHVEGLPRRSDGDDESAQAGL